MSNALDWLRQNGAPADVIADAESGVLRQQDYTKKTQQLAYLTEQLMGQQRQQVQQAPSRRRVDEVFETLGDDENGKALKQLFSPIVEAIYQDVDGTLGQENRQLKEVLTRMVRSTQAKDGLREALLPKYGDRILDVLPKLEKFAEQELLNGRGVHPEVVLWDLAPNEAAAARAQKQQDEEKARQRSTLGGFEQVSRTAPPSGGGSGFGPAPSAAAPGFSPSAPKPSFDPVASYHEIADLVRTGASSGA